MKITKFDHALLSIEIDSKIVVIDPGVYSSQLPDFKNVVAICLTHIARRPQLLATRSKNLA